MNPLRAQVSWSWPINDVPVFKCHSKRVYSSSTSIRIIFIWISNAFKYLPKTNESKSMRNVCIWHMFTTFPSSRLQCKICYPVHVPLIPVAVRIQILTLHFFSNNFLSSPRGPSIGLAISSSLLRISFKGPELCGLSALTRDAIAGCLIFRWCRIGFGGLKLELNRDKACLRAGTTSSTTVVSVERFGVCSLFGDFLMGK